MLKTTLPLASTDDSRSTPPLFSRFGVVTLTIGMVVAFFVVQLIGVYLAGKLVLPITQSSRLDSLFYVGSNDGTVVSLSVIFTSVIITALIVLIIRLKGARVPEYLALKRFSIATGIGMFALLLLFAIVSQALSYWIKATPLVFVDPLFESVISVWLLIFAMVIAAPIYEELVFRGILWTAIAEQFDTSRAGKWGINTPSVTAAVTASLITSVIFALIHLQYGWYEINTIVLLALLFCLARVVSGSLWLPIILHIINNGIAMWLYISQVN